MPAHPSDGFDNFVVQLLKGAREDRLVMSHTIAKSAKDVKSSVHCRSLLTATLCEEPLVQSLPPKRGVIRRAKKSDSEAKIKFGDQGVGAVVVVVFF